MDDTGTFPIGDWLREFCKGMIKRGLNRKVSIDCNMRFGALSFQEYRLMKQAGFRLILFGLESANQKTLERINKNLKVETIINSCKDARRAGLYPHITVMFGYPWESYEEALRTLKLTKWLLKKGYAYTMQATIVVPYPMTPLFKECKEHNLLYTLDWSHYDMRMPVMKINFSQKKLFKLIKNVYSISYSPMFILRKILSIRSLDDLIYFWHAFLRVMGHISKFNQ